MRSLTRLQVDHLERVIGHRGHEKTLAFHVDAKVIDASFDVCQRNPGMQRQHLRLLPDSTDGQNEKCREQKSCDGISHPVWFLVHWVLSPPLFHPSKGWTPLSDRPCAMSYARIIGIHSQFVSTIRAISRGGACPPKYPTVTAVAVIVFSIQLYLANECFLAGCLLTSQNMQPNMNTKPDHSRSMNGQFGATPPNAAAITAASLPFMS